jgi:hypothetical protein
MPTMRKLSASTEFVPESFLKGSGAIVVALNSTGIARSSNNPGAASGAHPGSVPGPPVPAQDRFVAPGQLEQLGHALPWLDFFDTTGVRPYRAPMTPAYVRSALKAAA